MIDEFVIILAMTMRSWLGLFIVFILSDTITALIGAVHLWSLRLERRSPLFYLKFLLAGYFFQGITALIASLDRPHNISYSDWFILWQVLGRTVLSVTMWAFVLYLVGYRGESVPRR